MKKKCEKWRKREEMRDEEKARERQGKYDTQMGGQTGGGPEALLKF